MIEFMNTMILLPYNLFAYIFSIFVWVLAVSYTLKWYEDALDSSDILHQKAQKFLDSVNKRVQKLKKILVRR